MTEIPGGVIRGRGGRRLIELARRLARHPRMSPALALVVWLTCRRLGAPARDPRAIRIVALNDFRYRPDLNELAARDDVDLFALPDVVQAMVNGIWNNRIRRLTDLDPDAYQRNAHPAIRSARRRMRAGLRRLLAYLKVHMGVDAVVTCTFYYDQDREWEAAAPLAGVGSFALHKENMKPPAIHEETIARYRRRSFRFVGTRIFLFNHLEESILLKAGCITPGRASVIGGLRMDTLHRDIERGRYDHPRKEVVFFSSHHAIGLLQLTRSVGYFSDDPSEGFVEWFDRSHAAMARFALENGDVQVWIKPKWMDGWFERIDAAVRTSLGVGVEEIPNLHVGVERDAQSLIERCSVVVGINSTTLLEAKLAGRHVVVPMLAEAAGKYHDKHVYFHEYEDAFEVARDARELQAIVGDALEGRIPVRETPPGLIADYLGRVDGRVGDRVVDAMRTDVGMLRAQRDERVR